jgi:hypothetical protein
MKKILGLVFIAVFACTAFVAVATAFAETTLLAEWLRNGVSITELMSTESEGGILLEDKKFGAAILCEGIFDGSVGPNGEDETTEILTLTGAVINLEAGKLVSCVNDPGSSCEAEAAILAAPEGLPWHTTLFLMENEAFLDLVESASYSVECRILFVKTSEECTVTDGEFEVLNVTEPLPGVEAMGAVTPAGNCTLGGTGAGVEEFDPGNVTELLGATLSVSSE